MRHKLKSKLSHFENLSPRDIEKTALIIVTATFFLLTILSIFRFALYDERLYLHETSLMSLLLKQGKWVGNYGVGIHGFLFKLPVAIIYILTGPSVFIATLFHIVLATLSVYIFFRILKDHTQLGGWVILALLLLVTNYSFISWSITFHRETPVLFSLLLFIKKFLEKKSPVILGLLLLLILEAKEYVFFVVVFSLIVWLFFYQVQTHKPKIIKIIKGFIADGFLMLAPSALYLVLMFATPLIPINMFDASILGLTKNSYLYQLRHIKTNNYETQKPSLVYQELVDTLGESTKKPQDKVPTKKAPVLLKKTLTTLLGYTEKLFYLSSFSFQSIPIIILVPSIVFSITSFLLWKKTKNLQLTFLPVFLWVYMTIYFLKISHQRYLYPLIPIIIIFFTLFIKRYYENKLSQKISKIILTFLSLFILVLILYPNENIYKKVFEVAASLAILIPLYVSRKYHRKALVACLALMIPLSTLLISISASIFANQMAKSVTWGINGETKTIAGLVKKDDVIYINDTGITNEMWLYLIKFYRQDPSLKPEWHWKLQDWVPKKKMLKQDCCTNTYYYFPRSDVASFKRAISSNHINKILIVASTYENVTFYQQDKIPELLKQEWLSLSEIRNLKNKVVYIFEVNNPTHEEAK